MEKKMKNKFKMYETDEKIEFIKSTKNLHCFNE